MDHFAATLTPDLVRLDSRSALTSHAVADRIMRIPRATAQIKFRQMSEAMLLR